MTSKEFFQIVRLLNGLPEDFDLGVSCYNSFKSKSPMFDLLLTKALRYKKRTRFIKEMELKYSTQLDTAKMKADADLEKLITTNRNKTFLAAQQSSDRLQQQVNTLDGQPRTGQAPAGVDPSKQG